MSMTGANRTPIGMPVPKPVVNTGGMSLLKPSYLKSGTEQSQPAPASQVVNQFHQPDYSQFVEAQNYTEEQAYGDIPSSFNKPPSIDKPPKNEKSADKDYRRHDDRDRGRRDRYDDRDRGDRRNRDRHDNRDRDRERHDHRDRDYRDRSYDRDDYRSSRSSNSSSRKRDTSSDREQETNDRKKKRKSRFGDETEKAFIPGMPTMLPSNLTKDQEEAYLGSLCSKIYGIWLLLPAFGFMFFRWSSLYSVLKDLVQNLTFGFFLFFLYIIIMIIGFGAPASTWQN